MKTTLALAALAAALLPATIADARPMTPADMLRLQRMGAPSVSPDEKYALVPVSIAKDDLSGRTSRYMLYDLATGRSNWWSLEGMQTSGARFGGDGAVWFLSNQSGKTEVWRMPWDGAPQQVTDLKTDGIGDFVLAPDASSLVLLADRNLDCADFVCANVEAAEGQGSALEFDEIFVRHWDSWVEPGVKAQIFGFRLEGGEAVGNGVVLGQGLTGNTPSRPFGGTEEIAVGKDGMVYFAQREGGKAEPSSTNLDIYRVPVDGSRRPENLTDANEAYDSLPTLSPDGRTLAYVAMARPGYESDKLTIMLRDLASGRTRALTDDWDLSAGSMSWTPDGRALIVGVGETLEHPLYRIDVTSGKRQRLTRDGNAGNAVPLKDGRIVFTMNNLAVPSDLYLYAPKGGTVTQKTFINADLLKQFDPVEYEKFSFAGAGGDRVWGFRLKPAEAQGPLPVAFLVHGGPQGSFANSWSTRWNPRMFSAPGYGVVSIDFHGSTGYGQDFTDSINKDWGGKPLEDLKLGLAAALEADPQLDGERICAAGGSYGGYMMNWIAGNWSDRFDCLINHAGLFDMRSFYYVTEEQWFPRWDFGGSYEEQKALYEKWNPVNHVDKWETPMLVIHGLKDYRVPYGQGLGAFTALQERDVPSKLLIFPDENHWILDGQNWMRWQNEVHEWMGRWTAPEIDRSLDMME